MRFLIILLACLVVACIGDNGVTTPEVTLNTASHEQLDVSWEGGPIRADIRWRFISSEKSLIGEAFITGSWNITFRNPSPQDYLVNVIKLTFQDASGFQVAEYAPVSGVESALVGALQTNPRQGNFYFSVATIELANTITSMNVWTTIY